MKIDCAKVDGGKMTHQNFNYHFQAPDPKYSLKTGAQTKEKPMVMLSSSW